ncbi:hypothetical protein FHX37_4490 [Haloactinospora alba]|uniref:DUF5753 domain-containing protein n=1 Tax=Haloactinospora alba TaxID=405555 RepID=A0A543N7F2_9ACTN|nr:DUF5753 domain-containing protein [Haloactinospora alba]TQN27761.1 hypothetical protein FHX37_4490 [Haloactinospora alba]
MERRATVIQDYTPLVVPGILQTEDYARATIQAVSRTVSEEEAAARAHGRVKRQEILSGDHPPSLSAVIDEAVLRRRLGSPETMRGQLDHLWNVAGWRYGEVLVIPTGGWNHPGLEGMFRLLKVPETEDGTILYQEAGAMGGVSIDPALVEEHIALMSDLRGLALPPSSHVP